MKIAYCYVLKQMSTDEDSVSVVKFKDRIGQPDCRICLENFSDAHKTVVVGLCNHLFCMECFDAVMAPKSETLLGSQSFSKKPFLCPLCRDESPYLFVFDAKNIVHESAVDK